MCKQKEMKEEGREEGKKKVGRRGRESTSRGEAAQSVCREEKAKVYKAYREGRLGKGKGREGEWLELEGMEGGTVSRMKGMEMNEME